MQNIIEKTYKIMESERRWFVSLPRVLAQSIGLKPGDRYKWELYQGNLTLKKV